MVAGIDNKRLLVAKSTFPTHVLKYPLILYFEDKPKYVKQNLPSWHANSKSSNHLFLRSEQFPHKSVTSKTWPRFNFWKQRYLRVIMSNKTCLYGDLLFMNISWASGDLHLYDNQSGFGVSVIFSVVNSAILLMAFFVHKAVYKLLERLPNRAINHIIYPSMVSNLLHQRFKKKYYIYFHS